MQTGKALSSHRRHLEQLRELLDLLRELCDLLVWGCPDLLTLTIELIDTLLRCSELSCGRIKLSLELRMRSGLLGTVSLRAFWGRSTRGMYDSVLLPWGWVRNISCASASSNASAV